MKWWVVVSYEWTDVTGFGDTEQRWSPASPKKAFVVEAETPEDAIAALSSEPPGFYSVQPLDLTASMYELRAEVRPHVI